MPKEIQIMGKPDGWLRRAAPFLSKLDGMVLTAVDKRDLKVLKYKPRKKVRMGSLIHEELQSYWVQIVHDQPLGPR